MLKDQRACPTPSQPCRGGPEEPLPGHEAGGEDPAQLAPLPLARDRPDQGRDALLEDSARLVLAEGFLAARRDFNAFPVSSARSRARSLKPLSTPVPWQKQVFVQPALPLCSCWRVGGVSHCPPIPGTPTLQPLAPADDSRLHADKGTSQDPISQQKGLKCPFWTVPDPKEELPLALRKPHVCQADLLSPAVSQPLSDPLLLLPLLSLPLSPAAHSPETSLLAVGRWKRVLLDGRGPLYTEMPVCMCINFLCICYLT